MMKFARKLCSLLLAIMMVMTACPVTALAYTIEKNKTTLLNAIKKQCAEDPTYGNQRYAAIKWIMDNEFKPGETRLYSDALSKSTGTTTKYIHPITKSNVVISDGPSADCYPFTDWFMYILTGKAYINNNVNLQTKTPSAYDGSGITKTTYYSGTNWNKLDFSKMLPGTHIRLSPSDSGADNLHSIVFLAYDKNNNRVYYVDCNFTGNDGVRGAKKVAYGYVSATSTQFNGSYYTYVRYTVSPKIVLNGWDVTPTYSVTYNANGGSGAPSAQTKTKDVSLTLSTTRPTRAGYNFLGWATSSSATSAQYQPGSTYTANANVTLYAVWEELNTIAINEANFPDANFRTVVSIFDKNGDGKLNEAEIAAVTKIFCSEKNISSLKGIEHFTALTELYCGDNRLTTLDVSKNTALERLDCHKNQLTTLDVSKNTALKELSCYKNQLTTLDVSKNTALDVLQCDYNHLTTLDVSNNMALTTLYCYENQLTTLDVSRNTALERLFCSSNHLTALVSRNTALIELQCGGNQLTALDVSRNTALKSLSCGGNHLTALDVSRNTALIELWCSGNNLTTLDVSKNTALKWLYCYENHLTSLDVSKNTALTKLECESNSYDITLNANRSYDLSKLPGNFDVSKAKAWNGCTIQGSIIKVNAGVNEVSYTYDCGNGKTMPVTLNVVGVEAPPATYTVTYRSNTGDVSVCTNIPDTKEYSLDSIVTLPEKIPTRPNGKFMYWQEANTNKLYQPGDTVTIKGNMELVAIWALDWSHEKNGLFVGIDCVSVTPGETVDIPVFINYESRAVLSLEGEYSSFEYETETGGPLPKFVRYIPKEKPEKTMPGCYVIGIARYDIPKDLNLAGKYYFHLDNISDLTILDENGPLVVIRNNVYPASGEQAKARNGWTLNTPEATTFTVRFNANGGYGSMAAVSNVSGLYTLPSCTFEAPSGKQFKGWAVSPNGNVITGNSYNITADTTFYAVWEQQEVTGCCLEVGKMVATHGKEVLVPISISQNPGFAGINVKIDYDKTRLQFIGSGDIAGLDWTVNTGDNAGAVMVSTKNYTKNGEILLLKFKVLEDAPDGFAKVSLFNVDVLTIDEKPISVTVSSGGVEVITRLPGDVTGDGVIDTRDALRLKKHLAGLDAPIVWQNADVTGDNDVTLADLLRLMKYLAGMQVELV